MSAAESLQLAEAADVYFDRKKSGEHVVAGCSAMLSHA